MRSSAVEVLVDCDEEGHNTLGVWDLHSNHVIHVKHTRYTSFPNGEGEGGRIGHKIKRGLLHSISTNDADDHYPLVHTITRHGFDKG